MKTDVYISYTSDESAIANALVHVLEEAQIKCWIAPRDISIGADYAAMIDDAIQNATVFVSLLSEKSQTSVCCKRETDLAVALGKAIVPVRIEDVKMKGAMSTYLANVQLVNAFPNPESHFEKIKNCILALCKKKSCGEKNISVVDALPRMMMRKEDVMEMKMNHMVFISHAIDEDKETANRLVDQIEKGGVKCWIAPRDEIPGLKYGDVIDAAIEQATVVVVLFSKFALASDWVNSEVELAASFHKRIIPVRIDDTELRGQMRVLLHNLHWINLPTSTEQGNRQVVESVMRFLQK